MRVKIDMLNRYVKASRFINANAMLMEAGLGSYAYSCFRRGNQIGDSGVVMLFNLIGRLGVNLIIDFEDDTMDSFLSKHIYLNDRIY